MKGRSLVILSDTTWSGTVALTLGASLPEGFEAVRVKYVGLSLMPLCWSAPERPPWGSGLAYDASEEGIRRNVEAYSKQYIEEVELLARWMLEAVNTSKPLDSLYARHDRVGAVCHPFQDSSTICHDVVLQLGLPSFEFKAAHDPPHIKYCGSLPASPPPPDMVRPDWYAEVVENSASAAPAAAASTATTTTRNDRKRIVFVAQGTEVRDHSETIVPCLRGLAGRPDTLVVAVLCQKGATLDAHLGLFEGGALPRNARVVDYLPYDAVLAHADVFVSNSGFGGVGHAIANAVPLVQCGSVFDKADIGRRVEYSGLGVYLPDTARTAAAIAAAVDEVCGRAQYKQRALALRAEARTYDPLKIIEQELLA